VYYSGANVEDPHAHRPQVPHPLFPKFELRVQTDGSLTPKEALLTACRDSVSDLSTLSREFTKEFELRKMVNDGRENGI
jgi:DNA-directed RNA polymerase II subunit RPB11